MSVFIIHADGDARFVDRLEQRLGREGFESFRSHEPSVMCAGGSGDNVLEQVTQCLDDVQYVIAVISRSFASSSRVANEVSTWMLKEALAGWPAILPVVLEDCDVPSFLSGHLFFDFREGFDGPADALVAALREGVGDGAEDRSSALGTLGPSSSHQIGRLREAFGRGKLTLFCGAGVSISAGIPGWKVFLRRLLSDLFDRNGAVRSATGGAPARMAQLYQEYFDLSPIIVAQYLKNALGRDFHITVRDALYSTSPSTSPLIESICELCRPQRERQALHSIVNFNFDDLIEQTLAQNRIKHHAIYAEGQRPSQADLPIYHVHGYLPRDAELVPDAEIVFSEDAYHSKFIDPFSWSNLTQLNHLNQNTCLFIGLGMTDPNLRRLLDVAMRKNPEKRLEHYIFKKRYGVRDLTTQMTRWEGVDDVDNHARRLVRMAEILEERDCNNLGLNVIWVDQFEEIPGFIYRMLDL